MNSDQLQDWLVDVCERLRSSEKEVADKNYGITLLEHESKEVHLLVNYLQCNYNDVDLTQPLIGLLLSSYYRGGYLRHFTLQFVPTLIYLYLLAVVKRQRRSISMLGTFFTAIYNEEIVDNRQGKLVKKIEEVRIPSIRHPSIYHDPKKFAIPEAQHFKIGAPPFTQVTVRIGPYVVAENLVPENRQMILTRILKSVNSNICRMPCDVICRYLCSSVIAICESGFNFPTSELCSKILRNSKGILEDDFSKKPRLFVSSHFLLESIIGLHFAMFNRWSELAMRALDAVHQRATYELFPNVLLVTNSVRSSLLETNFIRNDDVFLENPSPSQNALEKRRRSDLITNASIKLKKMPEDLSPIEINESSFSKPTSFSDGVEELKKRISMKIESHKAEGLKFLMQRPRKLENMLDSNPNFEIDSVNGNAKITDEIVNELADMSLTEKDRLESRNANTQNISADEQENMCDSPEEVDIHF